MFNKVHFYIPHFSQSSNGITILWNFAYSLSKLIDVSVQPFGPKTIGYNENIKLKNEKYVLNDNTLVIYPEIVFGNPLKASKVARFYLAPPGILNTFYRNASSEEINFVFSKAISSFAPQLNFNIPYGASTYPVTKKKKNKVSIYYGKIRLSKKFNHIYNILNNFDDIFVITRSYPDNQKDLYENISESKLLISLDPLSNLCYEANLLGTPVYIADDVFKDRLKHFNIDLHGFYYPENFDMKKILNYDFKKLLHNSRLSLNNDLKQNDHKLKFFLKMVNEYNNKSKEYKVKLTKKINQDFKNFYNNKWLQSPIWNATTKYSIFGYHLLCKNKFFFFVVLVGYKIMIYLISFLKNLKMILITFNIKKIYSSTILIYFLFLFLPNKLKSFYLRQQEFFQQDIKLEINKKRTRNPSAIKISKSMILFLWKYFSK